MRMISSFISGALPKASLDDGPNAGGDADNGGSDLETTALAGSESSRSSSRGFALALALA